MPADSLTAIINERIANTTDPAFRKWLKTELAAFTIAEESAKAAEARAARLRAAAEALRQNLTPHIHHHA